MRITVVGASGARVKITFEQMAREDLAGTGDTSRTVIVDPAARYLSGTLGTPSLVTPDSTDLISRS